MSFNKNGRTLGEDVKLIYRGIGEFDRILPGQLLYVAGKSVLGALIPCVATVAMAGILGELTGGRNLKKLLLYVAVSVLVIFLLTLVKSILQAKISVGCSDMFSAHEIHLTDKAYALSYESLESEEVRQLREQVSGSINVSGAGMASLYWDMESICGNLSAAVVALLLFVRYGTGLSQGALALLSLLAAVCIWVSSRMTSRRWDVSYEVFVKGAAYQRYGDYYTMNYLPDENMGMDIRIFSQSRLVLEESGKRCYEPFARGKRKELRADSLCGSVKLLCVGVCGLAVYALTATQALGGHIPVGDILVLYSAITSLILSASNTAETFTDLRNNNTHLVNYFAYMDLPEEGKESFSSSKTGKNGQSAGQACGEHNGQPEQGRTVQIGGEAVQEIRFEHVSFCYPGSEGIYALRDVSLTLRAGEKLAIVGENGSGKTTLIKLLCRLYRPTEGEILLNGRDIWTYDAEGYRALLSTVFQDFSLFAFALGANVAAARQYDEERAETALARAGLSHKVSSLPKGLEQALFTYYEEDGTELSGGEAQKVAIARALYKDGAILILDEPTAALDPYAEAEIYEQLLGSLEDCREEERILLSISHRLSTCRFCDRVAVFSQGRLAQLGPHDRLVQEEGVYRNLWLAQAEYYQ